MKRLSPFIIVAVLAAANLPALAEQPATETHYAAVLINGKKAGHSVFTRRREDKQITTTEKMTMAIKRGGMTLDIVQETTYVETPEGRPLAFRSVREMGAGKSMQNQSVNGVVKPDGTLEIELTVAGRPTTRKLPWPEGALMPYGLELLAKEKGLEPGTTYAASMFDADTLSALDMQVKIGEVKQIDVFETQRTVVETRQRLSVPMATITTTAYIDPETHQPVKAIVPMGGMTVEIITCDKAFALSEAEELGDLISAFAVATPGPIDPAAESLTYVLTPKTPKAELHIPQTDQQSVKTDGETVAVAVTSRNWPTGGSLPYSGDDAQIKAYLKPSTYVQSEDPDIQALAREAVGDAKTPAEAARNIEAFVNGYIETKDFGVAYASASEVLKSRRGDCSEHAVLTAALCRAVGIPTQVLAGAVYTERWQQHEHVLMPHAWNQVYIDGQWVPLDAAFANIRPPGADRIVLALGDGEMADFLSLVASLGNFRITEVKAAD
jgi:transglutaminase-like putative cysteine protease